MELTNKQLEGLKIAVARYKAHEPYTVISGYAGVGKSTLVKFIIDALDLLPEEVAYCAFTGKAAQVLSNKGCPNATTAHKLLFETKPMPDGTYIHIPKTTLEPDTLKLIVVDEVSMLPKNMWELLISHKIYVLACGDPGQLPPISKDDDNRLLQNPHIFLDEIMRQALDSDIIRCSMDIRNGVTLRPFKGDDICIVNQSELVTGMYTWADMILCATNKTRIEVNNITRNLLGYNSSLPQKGEKIICLQNEWKTIANTGNALVNGCVGTIDQIRERSYIIPEWIGVPKNRIYLLEANFTSETNDIFPRFLMDKQTFVTGEPSLNSKQMWQMSRQKTTRAIMPKEFTYGYCITGWKAQGSEWDKVLILEENFPFDRTEHRKFLYTCVTRASKKATLVLKN